MIWASLRIHDSGIASWQPWMIRDDKNKQNKMNISFSGYSRLTPKTILGKLVTIVYAIFGVPLMLILLSELGNMFAGGATKGYMKFCCKRKKPRSKTKAHSSVGYHKAPSSPSGKHFYRNQEGKSSSISEVEQKIDWHAEYWK